MSLEIIKEKILAEGKKEKERILAEAEKEAKSYSREVEDKIGKMRNKFQEDIEKLKRNLKEAERIQAQAKAKNDILRKKQLIIQKVFETSLERLVKQSLGEREKLLNKFLERARQELGKELTVVPTKRDKEILERVLTKFPGLKLSKETAKGRGGFVAFNEQIEQDYTFDNLILEAREELESEVARTLFS